MSAKTIITALIIADTIIKCAQHAPTSSYLQAYSIIRVEDKEKRKALAEFAGGQEWVEKFGAK